MNYFTSKIDTIRDQIVTMQPSAILSHQIVYYRSALVWSAAGGACGLAATAPWGAYTVAVGGPAFGLSSALSGWRPRLSLRWFSWGSRALGGLRMFGARVFSVPASCLAGWGCCSPHTLLNVYMEEPYEHKRAHTHRCTLKHSHWCKNRCSQTPIVLICCCFKLIL